MFVHVVCRHVVRDDLPLAHVCGPRTPSIGSTTQCQLSPGPSRLTVATRPRIGNRQSRRNFRPEVAG